MWVQLLVKLGSDLLLEELEVFAEDFNTKAVKVDGLTHGLLHTGGLLLHLSILRHDVALDFLHLWVEVLNGDELIIRVRLLNLVEYLQDFMVLVLHVDQS